MRLLEINMNTTLWFTILAHPPHVQLMNKTLYHLTDLLYLVSRNYLGHWAWLRGTPRRSGLRSASIRHRL